MNVEELNNIRVIRPPATSIIALVLRDCAKVNRNIPADLQRLLYRLRGIGHPRCREIVTWQDDTG